MCREAAFRPSSGLLARHSIPARCCLFAMRPNRGNAHPTSTTRSVVNEWDFVENFDRNGFDRCGRQRRALSFSLRDYLAFDAPPLPELFATFFQGGRLGSLVREILLRILA
jgi:hypothetical protein